MSDFSKDLGLDSNPALLSVINGIGQQFAVSQGQQLVNKAGCPSTCRNSSRARRSAGQWLRPWPRSGWIQPSSTTD